MFATNLTGLPRVPGRPRHMTERPRPDGFWALVATSASHRVRHGAQRAFAAPRPPSNAFVPRARGRTRTLTVSRQRLCPLDQERHDSSASWRTRNSCQCDARIPMRRFGEPTDFAHRGVSDEQASSTTRRIFWIARVYGVLM